MDTILEMLSQRWDRLLARAGGPLNFRLFVMPIVVTFFAVRAGMRDAREGKPAFFRTVVGNALERGRLLRSMLKDVGKIFAVAVVLDTVYQLWVLKTFILGEVLVVAVACAILPYLVIRSAVSFPMRRVYRKHPEAVGRSATNPKKTNE